MMRQSLVAAVLAFSLGSNLATSGATAPTAGTLLWASLFDGPSGRTDYASGVAVNPVKGIVYTTGWSYDQDGFADFSTVAYDGATGQQRWARTNDGSAGLDDQAFAIAASPDGSAVFVTGWSANANSDHDYLTIAYRVNGSRLWIQRFHTEPFSDEGASAIGVSPDGSRVFVTGEVDRTNGDTYYGTVAYDASTGGMLWRKLFNGSIGNFDGATALAVSGDGTRVFVTGQSWGGSANSYDFATAAYDAATGALLGSNRYNGPGNGQDIPQSIAVGSDGSVYVTGESPGTTGLDYATIAYDASLGAPRWVQRYDAAGLDDGASAVVASLDGMLVYVTGSSQGASGNADVVTLAYGSTDGAVAWTARFDAGGGASDGGLALTLAPDGASLFVAGESTGPNALDMTVLAYDASTGDLSWSATYDGPAHFDDFPNGMGVSPDGARIYLGGPSGGDFATVAFSTT